MKKKLISLMILSLLIITCFITSVQSIDSKKINTTESNLQLSTNQESNILESITIGMITSQIKNRLQQMPYSQRFKDRFTRYIEKGITEMENLGITQGKNLDKIQTTLTDIPLALKPAKKHFFLINIYPDTVDIETIVPTYVQNLTGDDWQDNTTIEFFIKLIPLFDSIDTSQRVIIRKLHQSTSLIYPAIGARIRQDNSTVFITAFGPGIKWSWSLF